MIIPTVCTYVQCHVVCSPVRVRSLAVAITSYMSAVLSGWIIQVTLMEYVMLVALLAVIIISVTEEDTERIRMYVYIFTYVCYVCSSMYVCTYI